MVVHVVCWMGEMQKVAVSAITIRGNMAFWVIFGKFHLSIDLEPH
jgi:hypothetical protein